MKKLPRGTKIAEEATGSWWWFVEKARELGNEVSISHPKQTKAIAHARLKSDKVDAAAIHRGLDFYYLCYDNESYANTGFQTSASTPYGARTSTEPITPRSPHGSVHGRRDLFEIWRVQRPPYLATISAAYPLDLSEKVYRASKFTGPKLFIALSPCPPGWEIDPEWSIDDRALGR